MSTPAGSVGQAIGVSLASETSGEFGASQVILASNFALTPGSGLSGFGGISLPTLRPAFLRYAPVMEKLAHVCAELDVVLSLALVASCDNLVRPTLLPQGEELTLTKARHPLVEATTGKFIPNDVRIAKYLRRGADFCYGWVGVSIVDRARAGAVVIIRRTRSLSLWFPASRWFSTANRPLNESQRKHTQIHTPCPRLTPPNLDIGFMLPNLSTGAGGL